MKVNSVLIFLLVTIFLGTSCLPGLTQTVGNGTVIAPSGIVIGPSAGQKEFAGSSSMVNTTSAGATGSGEYATRHYSRGETSGIGGSFIGTASPTSESSPAVVINAQPGSSAPQFRLPNLDSTFGSFTSSPALNVFTPALPQTPRPLRLPNAFDPWQFNDSNRSSLEDLPSFNSQPSFMEKSQFNQFGGKW